MILCKKCRRNSVYAENLSGLRAKYCRECLLIAISSLPNPDCEYCLGQGQYYWHSQDCDNDYCALAGGYGDCQGRVEECECSILDGSDIEKLIE
jgi:hypothetical protein